MIERAHTKPINLQIDFVLVRLGTVAVISVQSAGWLAGWPVTGETVPNQTKAGAKMMIMMMVSESGG